MRERDSVRRESPRHGLAVTAAVLAAGALLLAVLVLAPGKQEPRPEQRPLIEGSTAVPGPESQVPTREVAAARRSARAFLDSYLRVASGSAPLRALNPLSAHLRRRPQVVVPRPAPARKVPKVVSLEVVVQAPELVLATATLLAGGTVYPFTFNLAPESGRWVVTTVGAD